MSGLAISAFVLSLVCIFLALGGLWITQLVPAALGFITLATVKAGERRGRVLALWAIVIAIGAGSCSYLGHSAMRESIGKMGESVLAAFSAKGASAEDSDTALKLWIDKPVLEKDAAFVATLRQRFERVEEEFGRYKDAVDLGTPYLGVLPLFVPPQNLAEVGTGELPPGWGQGAAVWMRAVFEKGSVVMAIALKGGDQAGSQAALTELLAGGAAPIVQDIRFFRPKAEDSEP